MSAKLPSKRSQKKYTPQWQPEHWLMLWESFWKRLPIVILFSLVGVADLIRALAGEDSSWHSIKELLTQVFRSP
jgi:hypothetical protein